MANSAKTPVSPQQRRGRASKRRAILTGALTVFAQQGYAHASIDAIAVRAGVSTRTIYNHFQDKAELFFTVVRDSTIDVADTQIAIIDEHLGRLSEFEPGQASEVEARLIDFGRALATPMTQYAEHFALVREIEASLEHIPKAALEAWQEAGPRRVTAALADRMRHLADRGLLRVDRPERAATHFMLLVQGAVPFHHGIDANREAEIDEIVSAGVRAFLYGYHAPLSG